MASRPPLADSLYELACAQHGLLTRAQLAGTTTHGLHTVSPTVFRVPSIPETWYQRVLAAVLAAPEGSVATGLTALRLWGAGTSGPRPQTQATLPPGAVRTEVRAIPVLDPASALLVSAPSLGDVELAARLRALLESGLVDGATIARRADQWLAQRGPRPAAVQRLLDGLREHALPASALEERFRRLMGREVVGAAAVLHHHVQIGTHRFELDFAFPRHRVAVELDGWAYHKSERSFGSDRERDAVLAGAGWVVLRFTWADLQRRPQWVVGQVRKVLAQRKTVQQL